MYRFYKITLNADGTEHPSIDTYEDVIEAEGVFEFQKGSAMENNSFAFLMLLDGAGKIHKVNNVRYIATIGEGAIKPRLFEVKTTTEEKAKSYIHNTDEEVSADYYKRLGGAKQDANIKAIMLRGIGADGGELEYSYWVRPIEPVETQEQSQEQEQGE